MSDTEPAHPPWESITAYADGDVEGSVEVAGHLEGCPECRESLASIRALKHAIGQLDGCEPLAQPVRARVERLAVERRGRRARRWRRTWFAAAGLGLVAVGLAGWWGVRPTTLSEELVADHLRSVPDRLPGEVVSHEPETVRSFFLDRVDFDPVVPSLPDARLLGGRSCTIRGQRVQLLFYEHEQQALSLFVFGNRVHADGCQSHQGQQVCCHHVGGRTLMIVGPLPRGELDRIVQQAVL